MPAESKKNFERKKEVYSQNAIKTSKVIYSKAKKACKIKVEKG
jgi:hypothetical protein